MAKQISDALSVGFDTILCASRLHENKRREAKPDKSKNEKANGSKDEKTERSKEEQKLATLRGRTHLLIR